MEFLEVQSLFEQVAAIIEREFYDDAFLRHNWPQVKPLHAAEYAAASSAAEREVAIDGLLKALGVSHSILLTPELAAHIARQEDDPGRLSLSLHLYGTTLLARIQSFKVRTIRTADVQRLAVALEGTRNLVLDLRLNDGGSPSVVAELASMFLPSETPILRIRDRTGRSLDAPRIVHTFPESENLDHQLDVSAIRQHHYVEYRAKANPLARYDGTIVILLDRQCYSCGEVFVQGMKEFSTATIVGRPSRGFAVAAQEYDLSDGYALLLPFAEMRSGKGVAIEGIGVAPQVALDIEEMDESEILSELTGIGLLTA